MKSKNAELNEAKGLGEEIPSVTHTSHRGGLCLLCIVPRCQVEKKKKKNKTKVGH